MSLGFLIFFFTFLRYLLHLGQLRYLYPKKFLYVFPSSPSEEAGSVSLFLFPTQQEEKEWLNFQLQISRVRTSFTIPCINTILIIVFLLRKKSVLSNLSEGLQGTLFSGMGTCYSFALMFSEHLASLNTAFLNSRLEVFCCSVVYAFPLNTGFP